MDVAPLKTVGGKPNVRRVLEIQTQDQAWKPFGSELANCWLGIMRTTMEAVTKNVLGLFKHIFYSSSGNISRTTNSNPIRNLHFSFYVKYTYNYRFLQSPEVIYSPINPACPTTPPSGTKLNHPPQNAPHFRHLRDDTSV